MTTMCKFKVGDRARVTCDRAPNYDQTGTITERDPELDYAYTLTFPNGDTYYYAAQHLTLAPTQGEYR